MNRISRALVSLAASSPTRLARRSEPVPVDEGNDVPILVVSVFALFVAAVGIWIVFGRPDPWALLLIVATIGFILSFKSFEWLAGFTIAVGFFAGSLRMVYANWVAYLIPDILVLFLLVRWTMNRLGAGANLLSRTPVTVPFGILAFYCALEFFNPAAPLTRSVFGFRSWMFYTLLLFAGYEGYQKPKQVELLTRLIVVISIPVAAYGIWQWVIGPDRFSELGPSFAAHASMSRWGTVNGLAILRVPSSFSTTTGFAANMGLIIILALGSVLSPRSSFRWRFTCLVGIAIMVGGIAVSGSRMGPAILIVDLTIVLVLMRRFRAFLIVTLSVGAGIWLVSQINGGVLYARFQTVLTPKVFFWKWTDPLMMGIVNLWPSPMGNGLGYTAGLPSFITSSALVENLRTGIVVDSGYGMAGAELGMPGMMFLFIFAVSLSVAGFRAWRLLSDQATKDIFLGPAAWAVSVPIILLFSSLSASAPLSMYQWILIGMLLRAGSPAPSQARVRGPLVKAIPGKRRLARVPPLMAG